MKVTGGLKAVQPHEPNLKKTCDLRRMISGATRYQEGDSIDTYLGQRGLTARPNQNVWLHPGMIHPETHKKHKVICDLWYMPNGEVAAFHRTYLDEYGCKLEGVKQNKLMSPKTVKSLSGGACRLMDIGEEAAMCIGEGKESALACSQFMGGMPAWACTTSNLLEKFQLPERIADQVDHFVIPIDADRKFAGQKSSFELARRLRVNYGKTVNLIMPDKLGCDCLDIVNGACGMYWI